MAENIKLTTPDKKPVTDARYFEDYASADVCGKVKVGKLAVYYKDGLKRYCAPLEYIDRAFTRVNECNARTCCCAASAAASSASSARFRSRRCDRCE